VVRESKRHITITVQTLKSGLQAILRRIGLYHRLKASSLYYLYWTIADRSLIDDRRRETDFYRNLLRGFRQGDLIFDIGAHKGSKTATFLRLGARVVAVEPDEVNQVILEDQFLRYRVTRRPVIIVRKAVSDGNTVGTMWIDEPGSAKNTLSPKWVETLRGDARRFGHSLEFAHRKEVETTTLEQLIVTYGLPFFVKIDVEGYEQHVLRAMHRPVPYLSFEVNLPEFRPEGLKCVELLGRLAADGEFNYAADCRRGLVLQDWLGQQDFFEVLNRCADRSIEVFWKTTLPSGR
jgi:FkbM family methyltransferase